MYANVGKTIFRLHHGKVSARVRPCKIHHEASEVLLWANDGGPCCSILHTLTWNSTSNWEMKVYPWKHNPSFLIDIELWFCVTWSQVSVLIFHHVFIPKYQNLCVCVWGGGLKINGLIIPFQSDGEGLTSLLRGLFIFIHLKPALSSESLSVNTRYYDKLD